MTFSLRRKTDVSDWYLFTSITEEKLRQAVTLELQIGVIKDCGFFNIKTKGVHNGKSIREV